MTFLTNILISFSIFRTLNKSSLGIVASSSEQTFASKPSDTIVIAGHDAILPCVISNRVGKVQWTKNSVALGFNRLIPLYSNYQVIGDDISGNFSLLIRSAQLSDEATYECQVLPPSSKGSGSGGHIKGLRSRAKLTVSILPDKGPLVTIIRGNVSSPSPHYHNSSTSPDSSLRGIIHSSPDNPNPNSNHVFTSLPLSSSATLSPDVAGNVATYYVNGITNIDVREGIAVTLRCLVGGGRPLSNIVWSRGNAIHGQTSSTRHQGAQSDTTSSYDRDGHNKYPNGTYSDNFRDLSLRPVWADNGTLVVCHVTHPGYPDNAIDPVQLRLNVLAAPGLVEIIPKLRNLKPEPGPLQSYGIGSHRDVTRQTLMVRRGDEAILVCRVYRANPQPQILWFKNGILMGSSTMNLESSETSITHREDYWESVYKFEALSTDDDSTYTCSASNSISSQPKNSTITLSVSYPPNVLLLETLNGGVAVRTLNNYFVCQSSASNPPAIISWISDSIGLRLSSNLTTVLMSREELVKIFTESSSSMSHLSSVGDTISTLVNSERPSQDSTHEITKVGSGLGTLSLLMLNPSNYRNVSEIVLTCVAKNPMTQEFKARTLTYFIYDVPDGFELTYTYPHHPIIMEGTSRGIECVLRDERNNTLLSWIKTINGTLRHQLAKNVFDNDRITIRDTIAATRFLNQRPITCYGWNDLLKMNFSKTIYPNISFEPLSIDLSPPFVEARAGQWKTFVCRVDVSNPAPDVVWSIGENPPKSNGTIVHTRYLDDPNTNGKIVISTLEIIVLKEHHNKTIKCKAISKMTKETWFASSKLLVFLPPEVANEQSGRLDIRTKEGATYDQEIVRLSFPGYPPKIDSFECFNEGLSSGGGILRTSNLTITYDTDNHSFNVLNPSRYQDGNYKCRASNVAGNAWWKFRITVAYPLSLNPSSAYVEGTVGRDVTLSCDITEAHGQGSHGASKRFLNLIHINQTRWINFRSGMILQEDDVYSKSLLDSRLLLRIKRVKPEHSGIYACVLDDSFGEKSATIKFQVRYPPVIKAKRGLGNYSVVAGDVGKRLEINCTARGYPVTKFKWILGPDDAKHNPLNRDTKVYTKYLDETNFGYSVLTKYNFTEADVQTYVTCKVYNTEGTATRKFRLIKKSVPYPVHIHNLSEITQNSINITWNAPFDGGLPQHFLVGVLEMKEDFRDSSRPSKYQIGLITRRYVPAYGIQSRAEDKDDDDMSFKTQISKFRWFTIRQPDATNFRLDNLMADTYYFICVIAANERGNSSCGDGRSIIITQTLHQEFKDSTHLPHLTGATPEDSEGVTVSWFSKNIWSLESLSNYLIIIMLAGLLVIVILCHIFIFLYCKRKRCPCWSCKKKTKSTITCSTNSDCSDTQKYDKLSKTISHHGGEYGDYKSNEKLTTSKEMSSEYDLTITHGHQPSEGSTNDINDCQLDNKQQTSHISYDSNQFNRREESTSPFNYADILRRNAAQMNLSTHLSEKGLLDSFISNRQKGHEDLYCELKPYSKLSDNPKNYESMARNNFQNQNPKIDLSQSFHEPNYLYRESIKVPTFLPTSRPCSFAEWKELVNENKLYPITIEQYSNQSSDSGNGSIPSPLILNNGTNSPFSNNNSSTTGNSNKDTHNRTIGVGGGKVTSTFPSTLFPTNMPPKRGHYDNVSTEDSHQTMPGNIFHSTIFSGPVSTHAKNARKLSVVTVTHNYRGGGGGCRDQVSNRHVPFEAGRPDTVLGGRDLSDIYDLSRCVDSSSNTYYRTIHEDDYDAGVDCGSVIITHSEPIDPTLYSSSSTFGNEKIFVERREEEDPNDVLGMDEMKRNLLMGCYASAINCTEECEGSIKTTSGIDI